MAQKLSDEIIATIKAMHARRIPYREIADRVGCSTGHVGKVVNPEAAALYREGDRERKLQGRPWTSEEIEEAVRLRELGCGSTQIARAVNRTISSVESQLTYRRDDGSRIKPHKVGGQPQIPDWVLADRDRRMSM
jgi:DNA-directed RNA polymerase specialized sigma24 family protein